MYSTGETAKRLGVTRDSLHAALRTTAPDAENRVGNRRVFTEEEVERLAEWFERRRKRRDCPWELERD
jgi:DNA-binding transcriptional MerR regulator